MDWLETMASQNIVEASVQLLDVADHEDAVVPVEGGFQGGEGGGDDVAI